MKNIVISDEEGGIHFYAGMIVAEGDLDILEGILGRLFWEMQKLEKRAPTPEGTRLNILEYSHDTLWKAQVEAKKILEEMEEEIEKIMSLETCAEHARRKQDKRLSDIEEFMGDL